MKEQRKTAGRNEVDMIHGPMAKKILLFAIPLAVSSILQQAFNAADLAVVGRFTNPQVMAAVGANGSAINLLVSLFTGLSVGANVVVANIIGSGRRERISDAVHTVITVALISGLFLTIAGIIIAPHLLRFMGSPDDVIDLATVYLRIYFTGMPVIMLYNFGSAVLRSKGDSRRPVISLVIAGILNVLLNLLFVIVFRLHAIGVALATVLSNAVSGGLIVYFLLHEDEEFRLDFRKLRVNRQMLKEMIRIGLPAGVQGMVFSISNVTIQSAINTFGADGIAGMSAAAYYDMLSYNLINAFSQTCVTFMSQNYGSGQLDRCRRVWALSLGLGIGLDFIFVNILYIARYQFLGIFTQDPDVLRFALIRVTNAAMFHYICSLYEITAGALRGLNRSTIPAVISTTGTCAIRLLYVLVLFPHYRTPEMLIRVYPITWVITAIAMNTAFFIVMRRLTAGKAK